MKIGIITINSAHNYGCMLQAFALQHYLEKQGNQVTIINYRIPAIDNVYRLQTEKVRFCSPVLQKLYTGIRSIKFHLQHKSSVKKYRRFEDFIAHRLHTTRAYTSLQDIRNEQNGKYDCLITGSDQVWNGEITRGLKPVYFLAFDTMNTRKISYASSVGKRELKDYEKAFFAKYLNQYQYLSCREESARTLLQPLVHQKMEVVLDPTFLLDRKDYDTIKRKTKISDRYILVHIVNSDSAVRPVAAKLSELTGLPIIHNRPIKKYNNELPGFHGAGPCEFISLIEGAEYIVTNSFHATAFAIIYERPFLTIPHHKYPERMKQLLRVTDLTNHLIDSCDELTTEKQCQVEYEKVREKLEKEKKKSIDYLEHAMKE